MKQVVWGFLLLLAVCSSCREKKVKQPFSAITEMVDSASWKQKRKADTVPVAKPEEAPHPIEADELFDDFIFNYAADDNLQRQRTIFPLPYYDEDTPLKIEEKDWKHDHLFSNQNYYTLLFDNEADMDLVGDTSLTSVQVEWILLREHKVKKYYFERIKGMWMLEAVNVRPVEEDENENFVDLCTSVSMYASPCCLLPWIPMMSFPFWRQRWTLISGLRFGLLCPQTVCLTSITGRKTRICPSRKF